MLMKFTPVDVVNIIVQIAFMVKLGPGLHGGYGIIKPAISICVLERKHPICRFKSKHFYSVVSEKSFFYFICFFLVINPDENIFTAAEFWLQFSVLGSSFKKTFEGARPKFLKTTVICC